MGFRRHQWCLRNCDRASFSRIMSKCGLIGISLLLTLCCVNSLQKGGGSRGGRVFMTTRGSFAPMHANRAGNDETEDDDMLGEDSSPMVQASELKAKARSLWAKAVKLEEPPLSSDSSKGATSWDDLADGVSLSQSDTDYNMDTFGCRRRSQSQSSTYQKYASDYSALDLRRRYSGEYTDRRRIVSKSDTRRRESYAIGLVRRRRTYSKLKAGFNRRIKQLKARFNRWKRRQGQRKGRRLRPKAQKAYASKSSSESSIKTATQNEEDAAEDLAQAGFKTLHFMCSSSADHVDTWLDFGQPDNPEFCVNGRGGPNITGHCTTVADQQANMTLSNKTVTVMLAEGGTNDLDGPRLCIIVKAETVTNITLADAADLAQAQVRKAQKEKKQRKRQKEQICTRVDQDQYAKPPHTKIACCAGLVHVSEDRPLSRPAAERLKYPKVEMCREKKPDGGLFAGMAKSHTRRRRNSVQSDIDSGRRRNPLQRAMQRAITRRRRKKEESAS